MINRNNVQEGVNVINEVNGDGDRLLAIIDEFERNLWLKHPENPRISQGQTMLNKADRAVNIFVNWAKDGGFTEGVMVQMVKEFNVLALRLSSLILDLNGKGKIVIVPSKRNYLYAGKSILLGTLKELSSYSNIENKMKSDELLGILRSYVAGKADDSCQDILEFRLINVLIVFLTLFIDDRQTISFISQLFLNQEQLILNN